MKNTFLTAAVAAIVAMTIAAPASAEWSWNGGAYEQPNSQSGYNGVTGSVNDSNGYFDYTISTGAGGTNNFDATDPNVAIGSAWMTQSTSQGNLESDGAIQSEDYLAGSTGTRASVGFLADTADTAVSGLNQTGALATGDGGQFATSFSGLSATQSSNSFDTGFIQGSNGVASTSGYTSVTGIAWGNNASSVGLGAITQTSAAAND